VDISLISGIPRVAEVVQAIRTNFTFGHAVMAAEFRDVSSEETRRAYDDLLRAASVIWEPHAQFKVRAREVIGIIRTGDATRFGNIILESK
jgi:D-ribose pyranase